jgi:hypothetical protein
MEAVTILFSGFQQVHFHGFVLNVGLKPAIFVLIQVWKIV